MTSLSSVPSARFAGMLPLLCLLLALCHFTATSGLAQSQSQPELIRDPFLNDPESPAKSESPVDLEPTTPNPATPLSVESEPVTAQVAVGEGDELVLQAINRLKGYRSVQAKLRHQVRMFDNTLVGAGGYRQLSVASDLLIRMELKIQLESRTSTFQQIFDGRFLWQFQNSPDVKHLGQFKQELSRVDMDVVRRAVPESAQPGPLAPIGHGGLPGLLAELANAFAFQAPQAGKLHGVPVWIVVGRWRPAVLESMLAAGEVATASVDKPKTMPDVSPPADIETSTSAKPQDQPQLPVQMPHLVILALGRSDLFPYRVEYRRQVAEQSLQGIVVKANTRETVTLELFEVQIDVPIDPADFVQQAGDMPVQDKTLQYLKSHGLRLPESASRQRVRAGR